MIFSVMYKLNVKSEISKYDRKVIIVVIVNGRKD